MSKQNVIEAISVLPENVSIEEIMYRLYIMDRHSKALDDINCGRVYSTSEVRASCPA
jgi:hypothetical protein